MRFLTVMFLAMLSSLAFAGDPAPTQARTWARRGHTPVVRVSGKGSGRISVAGLLPSARARFWLMSASLATTRWPTRWPRSATQRPNTAAAVGRGERDRARAAAPSKSQKVN